LRWTNRKIVVLLSLLIRSAPVYLGALFLSCAPNSQPDCSEANLAACGCIIRGAGSESFDEGCLVSSGFVSRLQLLDEEDNPSYCTAFLIAPRKAITAAHCLNEYTFGAVIESAGRKIPVADIQRHPDYKYVSGGGSRSDFALITLAEDGGELFGGFAEGYPAISKKVFFIGYGAKLPGTTSGGALHSGELEVKSVDAERIFAAAAEGQDFSTCVGDSGGPALVIEDKKPKVLGTVSTGSRPDCGPGDVSVLMRFTPTSLPADWLGP
jgi:hypothetical protein